MGKNKRKKQKQSGNMKGNIDRLSSKKGLGTATAVMGGVMILIIIIAVIQACMA